MIDTLFRRALPLVFALSAWIGPAWIGPAAAQQAVQQPVRIPVLVPLTGFLSLEGTSQRNGALLALRDPPAGIRVTPDVLDTGTAPEAGVNALEKVLGGRDVVAVAASMLGTQLLAMLPIAQDYKVPLVTVSGTARITELGNPFIFRFFPSDEMAKVAHLRYVAEDLGKRRPALVYQTTAYGQSGQQSLSRLARDKGIPLVFEEGVDTALRDFSPILAKLRASGADVVLLHLHSQPTALFVRAARASGLDLPIVAGSAMHQPSTAALLEPAELKDVCAESGSSPVSGGSPEMEKFLAEYRAAFKTEPDAFALGQYDGTRMVLEAIAQGARTPQEVRDRLASGSYQGIAMSYRSDGKGNMAHSGVIICYDGTSRAPKVVRRFDDLDKPS
jgi:branched-chain amino acid transport system substrate-binding protein